MRAPRIILSRNIPYVLDFFFTTHDVASARPGHPIDAMTIEGGVMLWCGHVHLTLEIHALRAIARRRDRRALDDRGNCGEAA